MILGVRQKKRVNLEFLGWTVLIISFWAFSQNGLRQLYFNNMSFAGYMPFLLILLIPIPFSIYINDLQKERYKHVYVTYILVDEIVCVVLTLLQIFDILQYQTVSHLIFALMIIGALIVMFTCLKDFKSGYIGEYKIVAYGFLILVIDGLIQIVLYNDSSSTMKTILICFGVIVTLCMAAINAIVQYLKNEREKEKLELEVINKELKVNKLMYQALNTLVQTIDAKDRYTSGHSSRVADYSRMIAQRAGKSEEEQNNIYYMGILHDIGKIGISDSIINKKGRLTDDEYAIIKSHPVVGYDILNNITEIPDIEKGARYHHERYDGRGYPDGLKGEEIPECARIIGVADAYDAMTSNRSYRNSMSQAEVRAEIERGIGTQFDPDFAKIMLAIIDEDTEFVLREDR